MVCTAVLAATAGVLLSDDVPATQLHVPVVVCLDEGVPRSHHARLEKSDGTRIKGASVIRDLRLRESAELNSVPLHY